MKPDDCRRMMLRDLESLGIQIAAYPDESALWTRQAGFANPPGNLALHVAGNLQHFVGHALGGSGYRRDRDGEFAATAIPRAQVEAELEAAATAVDLTLGQMSPGRMDEPFPLRLGEIQLTTGQFLAHLCTHLAYHLGQVDAHRRLTTGQGALKGMLSFEPLAD